ncbi:Cytochrome c [Caulifigura coniformis]|uniref:Cytochrome c n=1 Tax=Caulifigura coniformis TaxID=2527983 RepID=A0A517SFD9_9PLAN|nr:c-type cytochrome [Caulifigura coniformis]QDT54817.1 Cytochrome c [Caulifigura coniformis]
MSSRIAFWLLTLVVVGCRPAFAEEPSAVGPVMKLLRSGRVPEARLPAIVEIVGSRGNEHDLEFVFTKAVSPDWPVPLREKSFGLLLDAARTRKVVPAGDLAPITGVISDGGSANLQLAAIRFAGAARVNPAADALDRLLGEQNLKPEVQAAALDAVVAIRGRDALPVIQKVLASDAPMTVRGPALAALAETDVESAANAATALFGQMKPTDDAGVIVDAFLARKNGSKVLAEAVARTPPAADIAKLALRHIYAVGRSDDELVSTLGKAAGINDDPAPVTPELIAGVVAEVEKSGNAARGEQVFRRADLSCMKCHAVSAGGGQVGPDLSAVGTISPLDFLATSVLNPDQAIKEAYISRVVATVDGRVLQGIVVDRNAERLVLKDATGAVHTIAIDDIDDEVEGKSLMPKGLVKFMTRQELVDLVKFLSQLGRPGEYAIRSTPRFQRYRVLARLPESIGENVPNDEQFEAEIARSTDWAPFYGRVDGGVPLDEAQKAAGGPVIYLAGDFDVRATGELQLKLTTGGPVNVWLDDDSLDDVTAPFSVEPGRHRITIRIDLRKWPSLVMPMMELARPEGSRVEFQVVDGA